MKNIKSQRFRVLRKPSSPQYLVCIDLDETMVDNANHANNIWISKLEELLDFLVSEKKVVYCMLTGCNYETMLSKFNLYDLKLFPHFVAPGFGTELLYVDESTCNIVNDYEWTSYSKQELYTKDNIRNILNFLHESDIDLVDEGRGFNPHKDSFYYYVINHENDWEKIKIIQHVAEHFNIRSVISKCNPNIGDPENAYDIDFIPMHAGKENVAKYLVKKLRIDHKRTVAFGDSQNDLHLLKYVANGFAVSNCTEGLKAYSLPMCKYDHAHGVYEQLKQLFKL
jgi:kanosamine-6-phosphate phosphatase